MKDKKNIIITLIGVLALGLFIYIVYDKTIDNVCPEVDCPRSPNNEVKEETSNIYITFDDSTISVKEIPSFLFGKYVNTNIKDNKKDDNFFFELKENGEFKVNDSAGSKPIEYTNKDGILHIYFLDKYPNYEANDYSKYRYVILEFKPLNGNNPTYIYKASIGDDIKFETYEPNTATSVYGETYYIKQQ